MQSAFMTGFCFSEICLLPQYILQHFYMLGRNGQTYCERAEGKKKRKKEEKETASRGEDEKLEDKKRDGEKETV